MSDSHQLEVVVGAHDSPVVPAGVQAEHSQSIFFPHVCQLEVHSSSVFQDGIAAYRREFSIEWTN